MDVAIDQVWSLKEEPSRGNNWRDQEVIALLDAIKTHNLMKGGPSGSQLGHLLEPFMGFTRTPFQITGKLKNLRKSYLRCQRKGCTPAALMECPWYIRLDEMYGIEEAQNSDTNIDIDIVPKDIKVCTDTGIEHMFDVIKELNLAPCLTLQSFSGKAVRLISKMLIARGICASVDQVKSTLVGLRRTYIELRHGKYSKQGAAQSHHYEFLHTMWGDLDLPDLLPTNKFAKPKIEPNVNRERGDYWSEEETVVLLTSIKALGLTKEATKNTDNAARKLNDALRDSGYSRSCSQIQRRIDNLKNNFQHAKRAKSLDDAIRRFPFYHLYESIFGTCSPNNGVTTRNLMKESIATEPEKEVEENDSIGLIETTKSSRSRAWTDEETGLMLSLLDELNLTHHIAHRLSFEVACEVVQPLIDHGYRRSAMQIQIKLRNLRKSYYRCIRAGCTKEAIDECPFYYKLDGIFQRPIIDRKLRTLKKLEPADSNHVNVSDSYNDHSYFHAVSKKKPRNVTKFEKVNEADYENSEVWLPVETICDDDSAQLGEEENAPNVFEDGNTSVFEEVEETEMYESNEHANVPNEMADPLEESTNHVDDDTGQYACSIENASKETTCDVEKPGPSRRISVQGDSSTLTRKSRRNLANPYSLRTKKDSPTLRSMRIIMAEVLRHEKLLQRQHHVWMERQFEMQRKHDREQRELLIKELREFRKSVTPTMTKQQQVVNNQR